jgi:adenine-specific DNA-methyltransferase
MNNKPKLELTWIGKEEQPKLEPRILIEDPEKSYGYKHTENMLIYGDNLLALKALEQDFAGKIKCIYIDPPYNTGGAFEHYDDNLEHSIWLNLIKPRIELLRNLLREDGSIWISIDDDESHYLKVLCDEIFGRNNFVNNVIWEKKYTVSNDARWLSDNHDHILVFAKNKEVLQLNRLPRTEEMNSAYRNPDNHQKGPWKSTPLHAKSGSETAERFSYTFKNGVTWSPPAGTFPRFAKDTLKRYDENDEIWFGVNGKATPSRKTFLSELRVEGTPSRTIWNYTEVGHNHEAREEVKEFNPEEVFATPKPERLIQRIITLASNENDWVLDSFLGSGTTSAVAHKMKRKWVGIELGEHCQTHCIPRLKKVCDGTDQGGISESVEWKGGGGFKYYYLAPSLLKQDKYGNWIIEAKYNANMLAAAMAKHNSFKYQPSEDVYWKQGQSSEKDFIYTTTQFITVEKLDQIHEEMQPDESLLICCKKFSKPCENRYENITIKKIPQMLLGKCEFGREDYSLNIISMPRNENEPEFVPKGPDKKKIGKEESDTPDLFEENNGEEE